MTAPNHAPRALVTDAAPGAIGPYSQGVQAGPFVYVSGQLPIDPATGEIDGEDAASQATRSLSNVEAVLGAADLTLHDVVKATVFLTDMVDFAAVNEIYAMRLDGPVLPARSAVAVRALPRGARVEIEVIAVARRG